MSALAKTVGKWDWQRMIGVPIQKTASIAVAVENVLTVEQRQNYVKKINSVPFAAKNNVSAVAKNATIVAKKSMFAVAQDAMVVAKR